MMTLVSFSTSGLRGQDRLDAWRSFYQPVLDVVTNQPAGGFDAKTHLWTLGSFALSRTTSPSVQVTRTKAHLKHDPVDHWVISYCAHGAHTTLTAGISAEVPARVPFLWSLGQEFTHQRTYTERIQLLLPRDRFGDIASALDGALGSALNTPLGLLLGDYMAVLKRHLQGLTEADLPPAKGCSSGSGRCCGRPDGRAGRDCQKPNRSWPHGASTASRAAASADADAETEDFVPARWHVPLQSLSSVGGKGGIAQYIQQQRLLEAHALLGNVANKQSITALADDFCFADVSSFSRAFRREFGYSPSDARRAVISGLPALPQRRPPSGELDFADLLRGF
jgi:AraC-like DNA-binding protein